MLSLSLLATREVKTHEEDEECGGQTQLQEWTDNPQLLHPLHLRPPPRLPPPLPLRRLRLRLPLRRRLLRLCVVLC